jgi:hypothetical protein
LPSRDELNFPVGQRNREEAKIRQSAEKRPEDLRNATALQTGCRNRRRLLEISV